MWRRCFNIMLHVSYNNKLNGMIKFIGHLYQNLYELLAHPEKNVRLLEGPVYKSINETSVIQLYSSGKSEKVQQMYVAAFRIVQNHALEGDYSNTHLPAFYHNPVLQTKIYIFNSSLYSKEQTNKCVSVKYKVLRSKKKGLTNLQNNTVKLKTHTFVVFF